MKKGSHQTPEQLAQNIKSHNTLAYRAKVTASRKGKPHFNVRGEKNGMWKQDAGYTAIHQWVRRWKKDAPKICQQCGTETAKKYEWANIDHKYRRVLDDYIRLCTSCHRKYDHALTK